jgi:hypothetical protein
MAESSRREAGYIKGKDGNLSTVVVGNSNTEMNAKSLEPAYDDLGINKISEAERMTHVHIFVQPEKDGSITHLGNNYPSETDKSNAVGVNIILFYTNNEPLDPSTIMNGASQKHEMSAKTYDYKYLVKNVLFYNNKGNIDKSINFNKFKTMVNTVNNESK